MTELNFAVVEWVAPSVSDGFPATLTVAGQTVALAAVVH